MGSDTTAGRAASGSALHSRRSVLTGLLAVPAFRALGLDRAAAQAPARLDLTPSCGDEPAPTISQTEGPFFSPGSPERHDLVESATDGKRLTLAGLVTDRDCRPIPGALLEIWHADEHGAYDNSGYRYRGHQFTDGSGRWWFATVVPAAYPGRTRHYHFKVQRPGSSVLTTQLYFPGEPLNRTDRIFDERLLMTLAEEDDRRFARYDFVL